MTGWERGSSLCGARRRPRKVRTVTSSQVSHLSPRPCGQVSFAPLFVLSPQGWSALWGPLGWRAFLTPLPCSSSPHERRNAFRGGPWGEPKTGVRILRLRLRMTERGVVLLCVGRGDPARPRKHGAASIGWAAKGRPYENAAEHVGRGGLWPPARRRRACRLAERFPQAEAGASCDAPACRRSYTGLLSPVRPPPGRRCRPGPWTPGPRSPLWGPPG